jgi:hypothetical protein
MSLLVLLLLILTAFLGYGTFGARWRAILRRALGSALLLGGIGFAAGFFGPIVFAPGANQGPLLGIFITGPAGFLLGLAYGALRGWRDSSGLTRGNSLRALHVDPTGQRVPDP